jgi:hypothetical protein
MEDQAALWDQVFAAFPYPVDQAQGELNRIAAKCIKSVTDAQYPTPVDKTNYDVRAQVITAAELTELRTYHSRAQPTSRSTPIVIVECGQHRIVVEGNNRVNKWVGSGDPAPRLALILAPRSRPQTA